MNIKNPKLTIISISPILGIAVKREIKLTRQVNDQWCYVVKGNAKEYFLTVDDGIMVFPGWGLPLHLDNETSLLGPKERFNFITGYPKNLLEFLSTQQINTKFTGHQNIFYQHPDNRGKHWLQLYKNVVAN